ncbi:HET-domain-containing protein [Xylaria sp. FL1042]|nr:HET-domain-containing protein [Xylaria sp. FL1042]
MRLLDTTTFELRNGDQSSFRQEGYAILSHRWVGLTGTRPLSSPQTDKIRGACDAARNQGIKWIWIDTCCINKNSATEESESINSMDVRIPITSSDIFKRWTLRELLAPQEMQFYDMDWAYMGTKTEMAGTLARVTGIDARYLTGVENFREACIAANMSWMASRTTTREEDMAYSMLGIFGVTMTLQYGEGQGAFMRLQEILMTTYLFDESLFAWKMPKPSSVGNAMSEKTTPDEWGLLATSPEWFRGSADIVINSEQHETRSFAMTPQGLKAPIRRTLYNGKMKALDVSQQALGSCTSNTNSTKKRRKISPSHLNCYKRDSSGRLANVEIYLRPTAVDKVRLRNKTTPPYLVSKRIRCSELGTRSKPITDLGEGVVLQPQPRF